MFTLKKLKLCRDPRCGRTFKKTFYFNTKYRTEMKLVPIIMDYCLLQFDALKFSLGLCAHGEGLYITLIFSM